MTPREFLLARIDEDEAAADLAIRTATAPSVSFSWLRIQRNDAQEWTTEWPTDYTPARVIAECHAKRKVLKRAHESSGYWGADIERAMLFPYLDHPDCSHEWWQ